MDSKIRKLILIILPILIVFFVVVSVFLYTRTENRGQNTQFIPLEHHAYFNIVYDKDTKVMYTMSRDGTLTPIYYPDGTLRLYKEE